MALIFGASAARLLRRPKFHRFARAPASLWPVAAQVLQTQRVCPLATRRQPAAASEEDLAAARKWLQALDSETIPKNICDVSFSRSSGPGGQNVNKVSSKATLRVPLDRLLPLLPAVLHNEIRSSRYYAANSHALVIQSDDSRKQTDNVHACFRKLHQLIVDAGRSAVPGETSEEQKERVQKLEKASNEARLRTKKFNSSKKSARKGGNPDY
ncbi:peptidyl-tRNA hydrolase domain-containing protein [Macrophomina phaseolina]|uniref:Peptidyl-tRNA hydrolase domain-containing protein n=1 Tax=Macrophomina phaseolina TaxID=35725 RepID=A0ABQ8GHV1_9PEZI|nr:peptidyl-tRNA hydrolase domain-containing protein [Macrophomina phaseolina]